MIALTSVKKNPQIQGRVKVPVEKYYPYGVLALFFNLTKNKRRMNLFSVLLSLKNATSQVTQGVFVLGDMLEHKPKKFMLADEPAMPVLRNGHSSGYRTAHYIAESNKAFDEQFTIPEIAQKKIDPHQGITKERHNVPGVKRDITSHHVDITLPVMHKPCKIVVSHSFRKKIIERVRRRHCHGCPVLALFIVFFAAVGLFHIIRTCYQEYELNCMEHVPVHALRTSPPGYYFPRSTQHAPVNQEMHR